MHLLAHLMPEASASVGLLVGPPYLLAFPDFHDCDVTAFLLVLFSSN